MVPAREAISALDLIKYIVIRTKHIESREMIMHIGNKTVSREINKKVRKESNIIGKAGATVTEIKEEIENATISIKVQYSNNKPRPEKKISTTTRSSVNEMVWSSI